MSTDPTTPTTIAPCPFCGASLRHVESWARSFDPPRLYHELHHPLNGCRYHGRIEGFTDDPASRARWVAAWNQRAA